MEEPFLNVDKSTDASEIHDILVILLWDPSLLKRFCSGYRYVPCDLPLLSPGTRSEVCTTGVG